MRRTKYRIRFRKTGDLRLISHHDLLRCWERLLRRTGLPFRSSEGFNPKPRLVFALSLGLGVIGCEEVIDLELDDELPSATVHAALAGQTPPGLEIVKVQQVERRSKPHVRRVVYGLAVPANRLPAVQPLRDALLGAAECWLERQRPHSRRIDIRPWVRDVVLRAEGVELDLKVTPQGTARAEEVLELLGLRDLLDSGAVLERRILELETDHAAAMQPILPAAGQIENTKVAPAEEQDRAGCC